MAPKASRTARGEVAEDYGGPRGTPLKVFSKASCGLRGRDFFCMIGGRLCSDLWGP